MLHIVTKVVSKITSSNDPNLNQNKEKHNTNISSKGTNRFELSQQKKRININVIKIILHKTRC